MESKKINQLATELAPDLSDLTIIGDPTTGISKKITLSQMASLFTGTVEEYANLAAFPITGVADTIYVAKDTNVIYRWDSTAYVVLSPNIIASLVFNDANGFDGTIALVGSVATLTITTALTSGSVPFIGASGALTQDNSNLFFDDTNNRLGIATALPTTALDVFGSGIIGRLNATSTNNSFLGFSSNGTNKWSAGNVQSDHRFRIFSEANSAELITILQTGEFGIGIANPLTKLHIDGGATALIANLDANVSVAKSVSYRSDNSARINLEVSGTESGSNVGADFFLRTFTDAGSLLETPFSIVRSTGVTTIKSLTLTNVLSVANGGTGSATQNFVDLTTTQSIGGAKTFTSALAGTSASFSSTATATAFIPSGATIPTNGMYLSAANTLDFATNTTNRFSISSAGNVQIDDSSSSSKLAVKGGNSTYPASSSASYTLSLNDPTSSAINVGGSLIFQGFKTSTTSGGNFAGIVGKKENGTAGNEAGFLGFLTGDSAGTFSEKMRISSAGNVGIGTSSPTDSLHIFKSGTVYQKIETVSGGAGTIYKRGNSTTTDWIVGHGAASANENFEIFSASSTAACVWTMNGSIRMKITSAGFINIANDTAQLLPITAGNFQILGGAYYNGSNIIATSTDGQRILFSGGGFNFHTFTGATIGNSVTDTERMRISSGGDVLINTTTAGNSCKLNVFFSDVTNNGLILRETTNAGNSNYVLFNSNGTQTGSISRVGSTAAVNYVTTSDYRLKEDLKEIKGLEKIAAIKVYDFKWKDNEYRMDGVLAHELQQIVPFAVNGEKDELDKDGNIKAQGVDYSKLVPILIKGMQEQQVQIQELKALINK